MPMLYSLQSVNCVIVSMSNRIPLHGIRISNQLQISPTFDFFTVWTIEQVVLR